MDINKSFPIYIDINGAKQPFHDLVLKKSSVESVVMSLGDKISGDIYYKDSSLTFSMREYIEYEGVKYVLVNPPTIVREGLVKDNSGLNGATKYSLVFYHPMYMLGNFPFSDIAVTQDEENYLSQNKTFYWIGNLFDFIAKLNVNLESTEWLVATNFDDNEGGDDGYVSGVDSSDVIMDDSSSSDTGEDSSSDTGGDSSSGGDEERETDLEKARKMSDVLSFDKQFISDALKTAYDTWNVPFIIDTITDATLYADNTFYNANKKFVIAFGLPTTEIYETELAKRRHLPYVFKFGQGVGLKNNSRNPKNNKIVTRIIGYGAERNIPFGYPQILWTGNQVWDYTIDNNPNAPNSYPIYKGIVGGAYVKLIKHPFTRKTLMPSIYENLVNIKVNPLAQDYDPDVEIIDYYDAVEGTYPNPINPLAPSVEIHQFEEIYPRLGSAHIYDAFPIDATKTNEQLEVVQPISSFLDYLAERKASSTILAEKTAIQGLIDFLTLVNTQTVTISYFNGSTDGDYVFNCVVQQRGTGYEGQWVVWYTSNTFNINGESVIENSKYSTLTWDDTMDDNGKYVQSYFKIVLPPLGFDIYACASITEQMDINMLSGACQGCTFSVQVDWDDYKRNFYDSNGDFAPTGAQRNYLKYPDSTQNRIEVIVQKDLNTFGTLMPNVYQYPKGMSSTYEGDEFVILGISLPLSYIRNAQLALDAEMKQYMLDNNTYYYDYPLKFDEHFLSTHSYLLSQIRNNNMVRFLYNNTLQKLYIKQISIKYGESALPQWDITLTDNIEVVLNKIGQTADELGKVKAQIIEMQKQSNDFKSEITKEIESTNSKLGKFYFYAGTWSDSNIEWVVSDTQAPFFDYTRTIEGGNNETHTITEYWVFNPSTNGSYTQHDMGEPNQDNSGWEKMTTDFKYLITEAIFANYAHFGSAIINGDWLISQWGTVNGSVNQNYIAFDPAHPNDNTGTNFIPNFCVDLKNGKLYSNTGTIGGFNISPTALTNNAAVRGFSKIELAGETATGHFFAAMGGLQVPVAPDVLQGVKIASEFIANETDAPNVAIRARALNDGAALGFALHGEGHIITSGVVCGWLPNFANHERDFLIIGGVPNYNTCEINIRYGNKVIVTDAYINTLYLPSKQNILGNLKIPNTQSFAIELTIMCGLTGVTLYGKQQNADDYPYLRDNDFDDERTKQITIGEVITFMLTWDGSDYNAWLVGYSYRNF